MKHTAYKKLKRMSDNKSVGIKMSELGVHVATGKQKA